MERESGGFPALAFALIYREVNRLFETFLIESFAEIGRKEKRILFSNKQMSHEDALRANTPEELHNLIIEQRKAELTRGGYVLIAKTFEAMALPLLGDPPFDDERLSVQTPYVLERGP